MGAALRGRRVLVCGAGAPLDAAAELASLLGADVVRAAQAPDRVGVAALVGDGPPSAPLVLGAIDGTGTLAAAEPPFPVVALDGRRHPQLRWADSGAMALTGPAGGEPGAAPGGLVARLCGAGALVQLLAAARGAVLALDPLALLGERAALAGLARRGPEGVGGSATLWPTADGWVAVNLARPDDVDLLPALTDGGLTPGDVAGLPAVLRTRPSAHWAGQAALLGLALGALPGGAAPGRTAGPDDAMAAARGQVPVRAPFLVDGALPVAARVGDTGPWPDAPVDRPALVVDLTSLWAGPLAGGLLARAGVHVVKVEGRRRPDGARRGPAAFFDVCNVGKAAIALDLDDADDRVVLEALVARAAVVLEGSRPRVMERLGIDPRRVAGHGTTWVSITGYGREGPWANRVAFGDDAAVAAGVVHWAGAGRPAAEPDGPGASGAATPCFVADALADPVGGLYAAAAALAALVGDGGQVVDVALRDALAYAASPIGDPPSPARLHRRGDSWVVEADGEQATVAEPRARRSIGAAAAFGEHTEAVRAALRTPPVAGHADDHGG